jgi:glycosyltransferase involved in cell wall biosynthesis
MGRVGLNGFAFVPAATGGSEIYFRILVSALQRADGDDEYVLFVRRRVREELPVADARFRVVPIPEPSRVGNALRARLHRPLVDLRPRWREAMGAAGLDLVHYPYTTFTPGGVGGRSVITVHDVQHEVHPEFFSAEDLASRHGVYRQAVNDADHVIASSEHTRQTLIKHLGTPASKVTTVHIAARRLPAPGQSRLELPPRYLFYPAASWPHKNHVRLLEAFAPHARHDPELHLLLTGLRMNAAADVEAAIERLGLGRQVVHLGYVTPEQLADVYAGAEALVFPSLFEGFGLPLLEAMGAGCPIVASRVTSIPEVAGDAALYFDGLDVDEMSAQIGRLLDEPELRADLAERGRERVSAFSERRMAEETAAVYRQVLAS